MRPSHFALAGGPPKHLDVLVAPWGRLGDQIASRVAIAVMDEAWMPDQLRVSWLAGDRAAIEILQLNIGIGDVRLSWWRVVLKHWPQLEHGVNLIWLHAKRLLIAAGVRSDRVRRHIRRRVWVGNGQFSTFLDEPRRRVEINISEVPLAQAVSAVKRLPFPSVNCPAEDFSDWLGVVQDSGTVCLHMRLGDVVENLHVQNARGLLSIDYWHRALGHAFRGLPGRKKLVVFSDSPESAKRRLQSALKGVNVLVRPRRPASEDFVLLASATTLITSNSGFSWWAALFGSAHRSNRIIAPEFTTPKRRAECPSSWTLLPVDWQHT